MPPIRRIDVWVVGEKPFRSRAREEALLREGFRCLTVAALIVASPLMYAVSGR